MEDKKTVWLYRVIRSLVKFFTPEFKIEGSHNLPDEACVIVGNHSQMYGPIASELYTPGKHYIWCAGEMMHKDEVADYAFQDFWSNKPRSSRCFFRILSHLIAPLSELIFTNAHTIPVYHDNRAIAAFKESIALLRDGNHVVVFPEQHIPYNNIVYEFQEHFVDLARLYFRKTKETLSFVPMYLAPRLKTIYYGAPIVFRPDSPIDEERKRISQALMDAITSIATSLPEHTVVPYQNMPKKDYPKNIPLTVYTAEGAEIQ